MYHKKIDGTTIDNAENLNLVMPMYNVIEYSSNYSETTEVCAFIQTIKQLISMHTDIANINNCKSLEYKAKLLGNTEAQGNNATIEKM